MRLSKTISPTLLLVAATAGAFGCWWGCQEQAGHQQAMPQQAEGPSQTEPAGRPAADLATPQGAAESPMMATTAPLPKPFLGRRAVDRYLIDSLHEAAIRPGLAGTKPARKGCIDSLADPSIQNPYSRIPGDLAEHHRRIGIKAGRRRRDIRDAVAIRVPRELTWTVVGSHLPRLELAYRLGCKPRRSEVSLVVKVTRLGATPFAHEVVLQPPQPPPDAVTPWRTLAIDLPTQAGEAFELTLDLRGQGVPAPTVVLANPRITGRPLLERKAHDLNVLLVIVDALRADLVGPDRRTDLPHLTPNIHAFVRRGAYFTRAYAPFNQTRSSTLAILTAQPPSLGGFFTTRWVVPKRLRKQFYSSNPPLLPLTLRAAGYITATIGHNRFLFPGHPMGLDHGFDRIWDDSHRSDDTERLAARALTFLESNKDNKFFLYLNLIAPHLPYLPPESYRKQVIAATGSEKPHRISASYLAEVAFVDDQLGRVFKKLDELELTERTVVVVTSDHGEVFHRAHACWSNKFSQNCHYNHGLTLYDEEIRVPLAFVGPSAIKSGTVSRHSTSLLNIAPTILDLVGLPEDNRHVGRSLRAEVGGAETVDEVIYSEGRRAVSLRKGRLKLHVHHRRDDAWPAARRGAGRKPGSERRGRYQLFDLEADPHETVNLAVGGGDDPRLKSMLAALAAKRLEMAERMQRPRRTASAPPGTGSAPRAPSEPATNVFLLRANGTTHVWLATLTADDGGQLRCGKGRAEATCEKVDTHTIAVTLSASAKPAGMVFESHPWDEPIRLEATLDGNKFEPAELRLGPFGLKLLGPGQTLATSLATLNQAAARHAPRLKTQGELGVFFWRSVPPGTGQEVGVASARPVQVQVPLGPEAVDAAPVGAGEGITPELRKALKEMGYSQ